MQHVPANQHGVVPATKPVFQDLTQRRWNSFLIFGGSASATILFLAGVLWTSVTTTPELPQLQESGKVNFVSASASDGLPIQPTAEAVPAAKDTQATDPVPSGKADAIAPEVLVDTAPSRLKPVIEAPIDIALAVSAFANPKPDYPPQSSSVPQESSAPSGSFIVLQSPSNANSMVYLGAADTRSSLE